jgi:hypothetical protein
MATNQPADSDWKKFRAIVPELRERYLRDRNTELISILEGEALSPTEKFWTASERIEEIGGILRTCLDDHRRSNMIHSLRLMYRHKMISDEDLNGFSEEVRECIAL